jgi:hypothetical protein
MLKKSDKSLNRNIGIAWLVLGLGLMTLENPGGWIFLILGISFIARSTEGGDSLAVNRPRLVKGVLIGLVLAAVVVTVGVLFLKG